MHYLLGLNLHVSPVKLTQTIIKVKICQTPTKKKNNDCVMIKKILNFSRFYTKFLCSSYDLTSGKKSSALMDMACSLTRAEWEDHFVFRKFALLFET